MSGSGSRCRTDPDGVWGVTYVGTYLLRYSVVWEGGLVRVPLLAELHVAEEQGCGDHLEDGVELLVRHAHHLHKAFE